MKQLNGTPVFTTRIIAGFEFTLDELDRMLQCSDTAAGTAELNAIIVTKHPLPDCTTYALEELMKSGAAKLLEIRQQSLKAITDKPADATQTI